jgi:hypothetical protein
MPISRRGPRGISSSYSKAVRDEACFNQLQSDPAKASHIMGVQATPDQIASLQHLNYKSLLDVTTAFHGASADIT